MEGDNNDAELSRDLERALQSLQPVERDLWGAIQKFVDLEVQAGGSRERAFNILRNLLRKARDLKAKERRAAFQIVK